MDSDCSSSISPAGKIRSCSCGKRMCSLKFDFHSVCIQYLGGGGCIISFLHSFVGFSGSSPLVTIGAGGERHGEGFGASGVGMSYSLSLSIRLPSSSASSSGSSFPLAPPGSLLAPPAAHPSAFVAQLSAPPFLPSSSLFFFFPLVSSFAPVSFLSSSCRLALIFGSVACCSRFSVSSSCSPSGSSC